MPVRIRAGARHGRVDEGAQQRTVPPQLGDSPGEGGQLGGPGGRQLARRPPQEALALAQGRAESWKSGKCRSDLNARVGKLV